MAPFHRKIITLLPLMALMTALLALKAPAQDKASKRRCSKCDTTGRIANPYVTEHMAEIEKKVKFCSYVFEQDKKGRGLPWIPCERCRNPDLEKAARKQFDEEVKALENWMDERKQATAFLKTRNRLYHLETEHFIIAWNITKIVTADRKTYKCHDAMHLYAERMEEFYSDFLDTLGITEEEMRNKKHFLYLFEEQKSCRAAAKELTGLDCWNAAKLPGNPSILISWKDKVNLKDDDDFHRHLIHHLSHLLNVAYYHMEWMAMEAGWADEGLGHFFEMKYFQKADNTCDEEGEEEEFFASDWEVDVRKALEAGIAISMADLSIKSTTALHGDDHKFAWSFVDFLMKKDPLKFKLFMKGIKAKKKAREALRDSYGLNFISFQNEWEAYVLGNYRKKPLKAGRGSSRRRQ